MQRSALQTMVQVREYSHWCAHVGFLSPCFYAQMKLVFSAPTHDWQGGSYVSWAGRFCCLQLISSTPSGFCSDINTNLMQDVCFLTRDGRLPFILGADLNCTPSLWQDLSMYGGSPLDTEVGRHQWSFQIISWCQHTSHVPIQTCEIAQVSSLTSSI